MSKKKSAPAYTSTTSDSGLWGTSTNTSKGTTYTPAGWMNDTMNTVGNNINSTLSNMLSNDYSNDANFNAYKNNLYNTMNQQYDQMLSNMANRGLMRSSGMQAMNNSYAKSLQDNVTNLYDSYYNRQANSLSNLLNTSNALYDYMAGVTGLNRNDSNSANNYNLQKYNLENSGSSNIGSLIGSLGNMANGTGTLISSIKTGS